MNTTVSVDVHLLAEERAAAMAADVRAGLTSTPKTIPPVWFYDERGSQLFDEITRLPEYYLTRAEHSILRARAAEIALRCEATTLVELGSGTSEKTRLLLDAMTEGGTLKRFVPFDVSEEVLREASVQIAEQYGLDVHAVVGDFHRHLGEIPTDGRRVIAFLGSTIGNLTPNERTRFLKGLRRTMSNDDSFLLGTDLVKETPRLLAAYDDAQGVTAEFNRNVLRVVNRELDADFDPTAFDHVAGWNAQDSWIEMHLRARSAQHVVVGRLDLEVDFSTGEELLTEISTKFTREQVDRELDDAGFTVAAAWTDTAGDFLLTLAHPRT
jgi:L-histidine N-alpha-methyltransferase